MDGNNNDISKVKDLLDLQADLYINRDKYDKFIKSIDYILNTNTDTVNNFKKDLDMNSYPNLDFQDLRSLKYAKRMLDLITIEKFNLTMTSKEGYVINNLVNIIDKYANTINELENKIKKVQKENKALQKEINNKKK